MASCRLAKIGMEPDDELVLYDPASGVEAGVYGQRQGGDGGAGRGLMGDAKGNATKNGDSEW